MFKLLKPVKFVLVWVALLAPLWAVAQPVHSERQRAQHFYEVGTELYGARQFLEAKAYFEKAVEKDPSFAFAYLKLAEINTVYHNLPATVNYLQKFADLAPAIPERSAVLYRLGNMYIDSGAYQNAITCFQKVLSDSLIGKPDRESSVQKLAQARFAADGLIHPLNIVVEPLPDVLNSFPLEYFPALTADKEQFFFTARKGGNNSEDDENLYVARKKNGQWGVPYSLGSSINTSYNEGTCSLSADGRTMVFAASEGHPGKGGCDLFISFLNGETWSDPENLGNINSKYWDSQPSLSADGNTLYFVSDRPGGLGRYDIWVSNRLPSGEWGTPLNLGKPVNTPASEFGPFIHGNGSTLFFSSSGHGGFGGQDLFYTLLRPDSGFSEPVNLGYPVNTHGNESSVFVSADGKDAYFNKEVRNRENYYSSKIYRYNVPDQWKPEKVCSYVKGTVRDEITLKPLPASVELTDLLNHKTVYSVTSDSQNGTYLMVVPAGNNYGLYINKKGYLIKSYNLDAKKTGKQANQNLDILLSPIKAGSRAGLNSIFFESNKYTLLSESVSGITRLFTFLAENPGLHIEIEGHTDDVGTEADNLKLSSQRAKTVADYLVKLGLPPIRITYKGYGKTKPLSTKTDEQSRKLNRRTEFKIVSLN